MPELAELKLTSDYVNTSSEGVTYVKVEKNPEHKGKELDIPFESFRIKSESKGKEIVLYILDNNSDEYIPIRITMGMAGHFQVTNTTKEPKHAHLKFYRKDGTTLSFVDVRRFGKWTQGVAWNEGRGPDPTTEPREFFLNIMTNLTKKTFHKPLYEVLMDQKWFNGIGNYLRAEIIFRADDVDPFLPAAQQIAKYPKILQLCTDVPMLAYAKGGGSIRDWDNPFGENAIQEKFMLCYGNKTMDTRIDSKNRRFWYDPKWNVPMHRDDLKDWDYYSGLPSPSAYKS
jgi:endonuclease VIII-like 1